MVNSSGVHFPLAAGLSSCGFPLEKLEGDLSPIFILDPALRITYCNSAWDKFALENGGAKATRRNVVGTAVMDVIPDPLKKFYADAFAQAGELEKPWEHDYECSSPELYRLCHMRVLSLKNGFFLVENSLRIEETHSGEGLVAGPVEAMYRDKNGLISMCAHCRRTRRNESSETSWDWAPPWWPRFLRESRTAFVELAVRSILAFEETLSPTSCRKAISSISLSGGKFLPNSFHILKQHLSESLTLIA
jgi:hypothetical protein